MEQPTHQDRWQTVLLLKFVFLDSFVDRYVFMAILLSIVFIFFLLNK